MRARHRGEAMRAATGLGLGLLLALGAGVGLSHLRHPDPVAVVPPAPVAYLAAPGRAG